MIADPSDPPFVFLGSADDNIRIRFTDHGTHTDAQISRDGYCLYGCFVYFRMHGHVPDADDKAQELRLQLITLLRTQGK